MADFDLSMVATFDTASAEAGAARVEGGIERMSAAEYKAMQTTKQSAQAEKAAAAAEKERAAALDRVRSAIDPTYAAQKKMNDLLKDANRLLEQGIIDARQYAQVQGLVDKALKGGATSAGQARMAYTQLGFQIQDITQSLALGINPLVVFGQQAGQTAMAVAGMGGTLGKVGTFLSGPWGSILLGAVTVVGMLTMALFENEKASDAAGDAAKDLAKRQLDVANFFDVATGAVKENSRALIENARAQIYQRTLDLQKAQRDRLKTVKELTEGSGEGKINKTGKLVYDDTTMTYQREYGYKAGNRDIIDLARNNKGDTNAILSGLREIANSKSSNRGTAKQILDNIAMNVLDSREIGQLNLMDRSLSSGTLAAGLRDTPRTRGGGPSGGNRANNAASELEKSIELGDKLEERIKRINEQFGEQPKMIVKANQASRELDDIIADLQEKKPPNFKELVEDAEKAKVVVATSLLKPFNDILENAERRKDVEGLIAAGREDEARALEIMYQLYDRVGNVTEEQRQRILDMVKGEREVNEEIARRKELTDRYLQTTAQVREDLEGILAGRGGNLLETIGQGFRDIQAKKIVEQFFGPALRALDDMVKKDNGIESEVDIMKKNLGKGGDAALDFANTLIEAKKIMAGEKATGTTLPASVGPGGNASYFEDLFGKIGDEIGGFSDQIVVTGAKVNRGPMGMSVDRYFDELTKSVASPIMQELDYQLGTNFFSRLTSAIGGFMYGQATGGTTGGILGALKGLNEEFGSGIFGEKLAGDIGSALSSALGGAQTGTMISGVFKSLGLGGSTTGAQIGGAIGSFVPIPGGSIIGSILGSIIGGLFKKSKYATASLSGSGPASVTGNKDEYKQAATALGGSFSDSLAKIADALDAEIGAFRVSIGTVDGKFRVSNTGRTGKLDTKYGDVRDFGKDGEAQAILYALQTAIGQGAIKGISAAMQRALQANSGDVDKALSEALGVKKLEELLKGAKNAFEQMFDEFDAVAAERVRLARAYGLDLIAVEALNAKERQKLIDSALAEQVGSLKELLADLSYGNLFEGTAVDRRQKILAEIADAQQDIDAGVEGAIDRYAALQRQLVETSREAFGTAGEEYGSDRAQAIANAERIIAAETERLNAAAAQQQAQTDALNQANVLTNETNDLIARTNSLLAGVFGLNTGSGGGGGDYYRDMAVAY